MGRDITFSNPDSVIISPSMVELLEVGDEYARLKFEHDLLAEDYPYLNAYC